MQYFEIIDQAVTYIQNHTDFLPDIGKGFDNGLGGLC